MKTRLKRSAGALAISMLMAAPALADTTNGYGVSTAARARNAYTLDAYVSAYRTGVDSSGNYTHATDTPSTLINGCNYQPWQNVACSGGASGTQGTNYNLTSATSAAGLTDDVGYQPPTFASGVANARSDLATGELGVFASSDIFRSVLSGPTTVGANAQAQMNDTLTFNIAGANALSITNITVDFMLDGGLSEMNGYHGLANIVDALNFGTAYARYDTSINQGSPTTYTDAGWVSSNWNFSTPSVVHFTGVYALTGAAPVVGFSHQLLTNAFGGAAADFYNTSKLAISLPGGVTYTSASGVFPGGNGGGGGGGGGTGAVPEPATWSMMILGFGAAGAVMRRRRRAGLHLA